MNHLPLSLWKSANLCTYKICYICRPSACGAICGFADPIFFAICGFGICWPKYIVDLQLPQIWKFFIFLLINTYLKCSNSNFYQIKNSAKQTSSWLLDSFAIKEGNFFKKMFNSLCLIVKNLRICYLRTGSPTNLRICILRICNLQINEKKFADSHISEICGFVIAD